VTTDFTSAARLLSNINDNVMTPGFIVLSMICSLCSPGNRYLIKLILMLDEAMQNYLRLGVFSGAEKL